MMMIIHCGQAKWSRVWNESRETRLDWLANSIENLHSMNKKMHVLYKYLVREIIKWFRHYMKKKTWDEMAEMLKKKNRTDHLSRFVYTEQISLKLAIGYVIILLVEFRSNFFSRTTSGSKSFSSCVNPFTFDISHFKYAQHSADKHLSLHGYYVSVLMCSSTSA